MKTRLAGVCHALALTLLVCSMSAFMLAADSEHFSPRFVVMPPKPAAPGSQLTPASTLQQWNGSFTYNSHQYTYVMVGQDPATGQGSLITTYIVPVKIILSTGQTFDPLSGGPLGPLASTLVSPIFDTSTTYTQGGVNVGTTQYVDAFQ